MTQQLLDLIALDAPGFPQDKIDRTELVNAFMSGHALAAFTAAAMEEAGYRTCDLVAEDWGWCLIAEDPDGRLSVTVRFSSTALPDGTDVESFVVSVAPDSRTRRRKLIFREDISAEAERLSATVLAVLETADGVEITRASYKDE